MAAPAKVNSGAAQGFLRSIGLAEPLKWLGISFRPRGRRRALDSEFAIMAAQNRGRHGFIGGAAKRWLDRRRQSGEARPRLVDQPMRHQASRGELRIVERLAQ